MVATISQIRIEGLHGLQKSIDIPIQRNRLILIGENGMGKSTVANLSYYLLTRQWHRLGEYRFESIEIRSSGESVRFTHEDIDSLIRYRAGHFQRSFLERYPPSARRELDRLLSQASLFDEDDESLALRFGQLIGLPRSLARRMIADYRELEATALKKVKKPVAEAVKRLESWDFGQFLYLPTYRRIEQDLKSIFRGIEIEAKVREFRERMVNRERSSYIELVEFGMEDVGRTIQNRMSQIKESVRTGLSNLTGSYLREVIRGLQEYPDVSILRSMDSTDFESMFARIDEAILPSADKRLLEEKISAISEIPIGAEDKVIAHFLSKLATLYRQQQENESDVREFVNVCNAYLTGKTLLYDSTNYEVYIREAKSPGERGESSRKLELKDLSSGEKQIVSLFSHVYLSGQSNFFVVIDEPELSLSVPWQQRFLPDIMNTGRCTGLIAVTHSPFIWENELEPFVKPLAEFIHYSDVFH